jgi:hypothetical protein
MRIISFRSGPEIFPVLRRYRFAGRGKIGKREKKKRKEARSKDLQGRRSVGETVSPPTLESSNHTRTGGTCRQRSTNRKRPTIPRWSGRLLGQTRASDGSTRKRLRQPSGSRWVLSGLQRSRLPGRQCNGGVQEVRVERSINNVSAAGPWDDCKRVGRTIHVVLGIRVAAHFQSGGRSRKTVVSGFLL